MSKFIEMSSELLFLIVDEGPTFREALANSLKTLGYRRVVTSMDGLGALATLRAEQVGFVICERNLRNFSGIELLKEIRESPEFARVPFMMMGGDISKEDVLLAAEFGIDGFLKKPFVVKDVTARISSCMQRYQDGESTEARFEEAREFFMKGNYKQAIDAYNKVLEMLPQSARVRVGLARCHRSLEQLDKAEALLKEAVRVNDMYVHAFHELGLVYLQQERIDEAMAAFDAAIRISPSNPVRYETLGDILMRRKRWEDAERYLMAAVKLELVYPELYAQLGKSLFAQKKLDKAARFIAKALAAEPDNTSFLNSMGICMKEAGKLEEAIGYYNQALKFRPQDVKILFNKALCLLQTGELERTRKTLLQILKVEPTYEKARLKLAEVERLEKAANAGKGVA